MFPSKTIAGHLVRGVIAAALLMWAVRQQSSHPAFAIAALVAAIGVMRGCPMCWVIGLFLTVGERIKARRTLGPSA